MVSRWSVFLAGRYIRTGRTKRKNTTQKLSIMGLAAGVVTLIAVMSVMNGLQLGFINDILEIESYHLRINNSERYPDIGEKLMSVPGIRSSVSFYDAQTLLRGKSSKLDPVLVRMLDAEDAFSDPYLMEHLGTEKEFFNIEDGNAVIGNELARHLYVSPGDTISIVSLSGSSFSSLRPSTVELRVSAVFNSGYYEFDRGMIFISDKYISLLNPGNENSGSGRITGIKLKNRNRDVEAAAAIKNLYPDAEVVSWREYNKSFFSALRIEKITMMFLIALIFVVIGVNIFNSIKRGVAEKLEDIAVLYAIGAPEASVRRIFIAEGIIIGLTGGLSGVVIGLLLMVNINQVFVIAGRVFSFLSYIAGLIASAGQFASDATFTLFPEDYFYLSEIPVRILLPELVVIFIFAVLSAVISAYLAVGKLSVKNPAEYLRYE